MLVRLHSMIIEFFICPKCGNARDIDTTPVTGKIIICDSWSIKKRDICKTKLKIERK